MKPIYLAGVALVGLLLGGLVGVALKSADTSQPSTAITEPARVEEVAVVPTFAYADITGKIRHSNEWQAKILVLNFWASWCSPCREETPLFVELQDKYRFDNVKFVGIAIDDLEPVKAFVDEFQVDYPVLMGDMQAITLSKKLGNRFEGLPYTIIAEPGGKVILRHTGGIKREQLESVLQEAIKQSRRTHEPAARI